MYYVLANLFLLHRKSARITRSFAVIKRHRYVQDIGRIKDKYLFCAESFYERRGEDKAMTLKSSLIKISAPLFLLLANSSFAEGSGLVLALRSDGTRGLNLSLVSPWSDYSLPNAVVRTPPAAHKVGSSPASSRPPLPYSTDMYDSWLRSGDRQYPIWVIASQFVGATIRPSTKFLLAKTIFS